MLATLITAAVTGLGGILLNYLAQRQARQDALARQEQSDFIAGQADATIAEKKIEQAAKDARDNAAPDFTTLQ